VNETSGGASGGVRPGPGEAHRRASLAWQRRKVAEGRCKRCGEPRGEPSHYTTMCDACMLKQRRRQSERKGFKPWRPGGIGRPPRVREANVDGGAQNAPEAQNAPKGETT
jgi:hypothetical protein